MADIYHIKKIVNAVTRTDTEIKVKFQTITRWNCQMLDSVIISDNDVEEIFNRNNLTDVYPGKLVNLGSMNYSLPNFHKEGDEVKLSYTDSILYTKNYDNNKYYKGGSSDGFHIEYEVGKSEVYRNTFFYSDTEELLTLVGSVKNGLVDGVLHADSLFMPTSINESILQNFKIAPNPSQGQLNFELGNYTQANVKVYTLQGKQVEQFVVEQNANKYLQHLNAGTYLITIEDQKGLSKLNGLNILIGEKTGIS